MENLKIKGSFYPSTYIVLEPNLNTWEDCKKQKDDSIKCMVYITVGDGDNRNSVGLNLKDMKKLKKFLKNKIKFLEDK